MMRIDIDGKLYLLSTNAKKWIFQRQILKKKLALGENYVCY